MCIRDRAQAVCFAGTVKVFLNIQVQHGLQFRACLLYTSLDEHFDDSYMQRVYPKLVHMN